MTMPTEQSLHNKPSPHLPRLKTLMMIVFGASLVWCAMNYARSSHSALAAIVAFASLLFFPYFTLSSVQFPKAAPSAASVRFAQADDDSLLDSRSADGTLSYTSSRPSAFDKGEEDEIYLPSAAFSFVRGLASKIGSGAKKAMRLGKKLTDLGGAGDSDLLQREVPWTQRRKRTSFGGRSDRASRSSSFGSNGSEHSFSSLTMTPQPSPQTSPSKGPGRPRQRRQPTMTRIVSGQGLDLMGLESLGRDNTLESLEPSLTGKGVASGSSSRSGRPRYPGSFDPVSLSVDSAPDEDFCYNGHLAVDVLPYDTTDTLLQEVKLVVPDAMLLQFGACLGESSAQLALGLRSKATGQESLYGLPDNPDAYARGWEKVVEEHKDGLHYFVHRRSLRKGLFMYKSRAVYEAASTAEMVAFTLADHEVRRGWDDACTALHPLPPPSWRKPVGPARVSVGGTLLLQPFGRNSEAEEEEARLLTATSYCQSSFMYARTRFPPPMAQREYVYARRVWYKADDGGCYIISKNCPVGPLTSPSVPDAGCRTVRVTDYSSGVVIRAVPGIYHRQGAVEVVTNYFEDSCAASGIINMAVRKALWPMIQKSEGGFRRYQAVMKEPSINQMCLTRRLPPFDSPPPPPPSRLPSKLDDELSGDSEDDKDEFSDARCILSPRATGEKDFFPSQLPSSVEIDRNAGMFTEYHPALSYPRLHFTPILYALYLVIMRVASLPLQLITGLLRILLLYKASDTCPLVPPQQSDQIKVSTKSSKEGFVRVVEGKSSSKVSFSVEGPARSSLNRSHSRSESRRPGVLRRLASFVVVASRAVTVPLLHQAMVASDAESRNQGSGQHQRAFNTTQQNIRGAKSKLPRTRAFVKAVLGQQLSDLREDFFFY